MAMPNWDTGAKNPTSAINSGTGTAWSNPTNVVSSNDSYATVTLASGNSQNLDVKPWGILYGYTVPSIAKIKGIKVEIERKGTGIKDLTVQLMKGASVVGTNKADTSVEWDASDTVKTYGGSTDLWGTTWNGYEVTDPYSFGVRIVAQYSSGTNPVASIDNVKVTIYFQCYIFESTTEDGYLYFITGSYDSLNKTGDNVESSNSSSTEAYVKQGFGFFNTAPSLSGKTITAAEWQGNINDVLDATPLGSYGTWTFHITKTAHGSTLDSGDSNPTSGVTFWDTGAEPITDGAGYYVVDLASFLAYINQATGTNSGYTVVYILAVNSGNDFSPETTYVKLDSKDKVGGKPMRIVVVTDETDSTAYTKTLTETSTISEVIARGGRKVLADSVTMIEALVRGARKVLAETSTMVDAAFRATTKLLLDTLSPIEQFIRGRVFSDAITLAEDTLAKIRSRTLTDGVTIGEEAKLPFGIIKVLWENVELETFDVFVKRLNRMFFDVVVGVDSTLRSVGKLLTEAAMTITDTIATLVTRFISLAENLTVGDTIVRGAKKVLSSSIEVVEAIAKGTVRLYSDVLTLTAVFTRGRSFSDVLGLSDSFSRVGQFVRGLVDTVTGSDTIRRAVATIKTDTVGLMDTLNFQYRRMFADILTMGDTITKKSAKMLAETLVGLEHWIGRLNGKITMWWSRAPKDIQRLWRKEPKDL